MKTSVQMQLAKLPAMSTGELVQLCAFGKLQECGRGRSLHSSVVDVGVPGEDDRWVPNGRRTDGRIGGRRSGVSSTGGGVADTTRTDS